MNAEKPTHFINKIINGTIDEDVKIGLIKFSKGTFPGPRITLKISSKKISILADYEYSTFLQKLFIYSVTSNSFKVKGTIFTKKDVSSELSFLQSTTKGKSKSLFTYKFEGLFEKEQLFNILNSGELYASLLNITSTDNTVTSLKTKSRIPKPTFEKSTKPPSFIKVNIAGQDLSVEPINLIKIILPDLPSDQTKIKRITVDNEFVVNQLIFPEDKSKLSSAELRMKVQRKGILKRKMTLDGVSIEKEYPF
ncbi:MAG: hypothetical protein ACTSQY_06150 [Candidatus Odinarchaeia archaeon]